MSFIDCNDLQMIVFSPIIVDTAMQTASWFDSICFISIQKFLGCPSLWLHAWSNMKNSLSLHQKKRHIFMRSLVQYEMTIHIFPCYIDWHDQIIHAVTLSFYKFHIKLYGFTVLIRHISCCLLLNSSKLKLPSRKISLWS